MNGLGCGIGVREPASASAPIAERESARKTPGENARDDFNQYIIPTASVFNACSMPMPLKSATARPSLCEKSLAFEDNSKASAFGDRPGDDFTSACERVIGRVAERGKGARGKDELDASQDQKIPSLEAALLQTPLSETLTSVQAMLVTLSGAASNPLHADGADLGGLRAGENNQTIEHQDALLARTLVGADESVDGAMGSMAPMASAFNINSIAGPSKSAATPLRLCEGAIASGSNALSQSRPDSRLDPPLDSRLDSRGEIGPTSGRAMDSLKKALAKNLSEIHAPVQAIDSQTHFAPPQASIAQQIALQTRALFEEDGASGAAAQASSSASAAEQISNLKTTSSGPLRVVVIELAPEHLGAVRISLKMSNEDMRINIEVERPSSMAQVDAAREDISAILGQAGYQIDKTAITSSSWMLNHGQGDAPTQQNQFSSAEGSQEKGARQQRQSSRRNDHESIEGVARANISAHAGLRRDVL